MNALLHQFLLEAREFIQELSEALLYLEQHPTDADRIALVFRLFHTLKGNSGLFEFKPMTQLLHASEDLLDAVRSGEQHLDDQIIDLLLHVIDLLQIMLDDIEQNQVLSTQPAGLVALTEALRNCMGVTDTEQKSADATTAVMHLPDFRWLASIPEATRLALFGAAETDFYVIHYRPEPECFFKGDDPVLTMSLVPELLLLKMLPQQDWKATAEVDLYSCNLQFYACSSADKNSLLQHFSYVAEQVELFLLPRWVLAMPAGEQQVIDSYSDFLASAIELLNTGQLTELAAGVAALLEILNPELWLASCLRWLQACLAGAAPTPVLMALLEAAVQTEVPNWQLIFTEKASSKEGVTACYGDLQLPDLAKELIEAQLHILKHFAPVSPGQLAAVHQTLLALTQSLQLPQQATLAALPATELTAQIVEQLFRPLASLLTESSKTTAKMRLSEAVAHNNDSTTDLLLDRRRDDVQDKVRVLKVPQEKIDTLLDLIGELVVAKNSLPFLIRKAETLADSRDLTRELKTYSAQLHRLSEDMRDGIMQVRMLPVGTIFARFPRLVRDVAKKLGKEVTLVIEGEETEADKQIVESLSDPLVHILRNSLDHGLETAEERRLAGKPVVGRLTIRALQEGERVRIEVEDDGRGIDPNKIKQKAFAKGLIDEQRLHSMSDEDAVNLVFLPGFSTAEAVSDLSGRGVGMDVVRSSLEKIGGAVRLSSVVGQHTRLILSLPLSISVSRVMLVKVDGQLFGIPLDLVVETVRVPADRLHQFGPQKATVLRDKLVPLYAAHQLLNVVAEPQLNSAGELSVLVVKIAQEHLGLLVDGFSQTMDLLLKPMEGALAGLPGYAGTALLGNGTVLLVLDLKELLRCQY